MPIRSTQFSSLPEAILIDILSRLPVKSLLQFLLVSRTWRALISNPHFTQTHLQKTLISSAHNRVLFTSSPLKSFDHNTNELSDLHNPLINSDSVMDIMGSCNGLVCLLVDMVLVIYNPSNRAYKVLDLAVDFHGDSHAFYGFGYHAPSQDYKLVRHIIPCFSGDSGNIQLEVVSVRDTSQRRVHEVNCDFIISEIIGVFLNGSIHWMAFREDKDSTKKVYLIVAFDLAREVFDEMPQPDKGDAAGQFYGLNTLNGCLCLLHDSSLLTMDVWVMKKHRVKASWTKMITVPRLIGMQPLTYLWPLTFISKSELLLQIDRQGLVVFNGEKNSFRRIEIPTGREKADAALFVESLVSPED